MTFFGATIPALMRGEGEVAQESGTLLFVAGLANAAGYLFYVLVGHEFLRSSQLLGLIAVAAIVSGLLVTKYSWRPRQRVLGAIAMLILGLLLARWEEKYFYLAQWIKVIQPADRITHFKSGAESATLLESEKRTWLTYNGNPSIFIRSNNILNRADHPLGLAGRIQKYLAMLHHYSLFACCSDHAVLNTIRTPSGKTVVYRFGNLIPIVRVNKRKEPFICSLKLKRIGAENPEYFG